MELAVSDLIGELPTLETERLILRKFDVDDAEDLYEYCKDPENIQYVTFEQYESIDNALDRIDSLKAGYAENNTVCWAIELKESGKVIGSIDFVHVYPKDMKAEIGYILNKRFWNQGYTTEATKKLIEYGFNELKLKRIQARCIVENISSARVMEKSGMQYEGTERQSTFKHNQYYDIKSYAIINE